MQAGLFRHLAVTGLCALAVASVTTAQTVRRASTSTSGAEANGGSGWAAVSIDGRFVAFESDATNLVAGDTNGSTDVFVRDRDTDNDGIFDEPNTVSVVRVSGNLAGNSTNPAISSPPQTLDGGPSQLPVVVFESTAPLSMLHTPGRINVYRVDMNGGTPTLVSQAPGPFGGSDGDRDSDLPSISADGNVVSFSSGSTNLVQPPEAITDPDVYVRFYPDTNPLVPNIVRVSVTSAGANPGGNARESAVSGDGRYVAFHAAEALTPVLTGGFHQIYRHDLVTGATVLLTQVNVAGVWVAGNADSDQPSISFAGQHVAFRCFATNLFGGGGSPNAVVFDFSTAGFVNVSRSLASCVPASHDGTQVLYPTVSSDPVTFNDGRFVSYVTDATSIVPVSGAPGDWHMVVWDRDTACTGSFDQGTGCPYGYGPSRVSESAFGCVSATTTSPGGISGNGRYVAWVSPEADLIPEYAGGTFDTNGVGDVFTTDRIELVLVGNPVVGGQVSFEIRNALDADVPKGSGNYGDALVLISCTGQDVCAGGALPAGIPVPGGLHVPLDSDACTNLGLTTFAVVLRTGTLNACGTASTPAFTVPASLAGKTLHASAVTFHPVTGLVRAITGRITFSIP